MEETTRVNICPVDLARGLFIMSITLVVFATFYMGQMQIRSAIEKPLIYKHFNFPALPSILEGVGGDAWLRHTQKRKSLSNQVTIYKSYRAEQVLKAKPEPAPDKMPDETSAENTPLSLPEKHPNTPRAEQFPQVESESNPASGKIPDEAKAEISLTPLPEKSPKSTPKSSSSSVRFKKKELRFKPIILKVAKLHQVDPSLVMAIIMAESGYNPKATSKRGAKGLMQLMPRTAKSLGVENVFDPEQNINAGVSYFKQLLNRYKGDVTLALAAYNAGSRKIRKYRGVPPFKATKFYIKKVFNYQQHYKKLMTGTRDLA